MEIKIYYQDTDCGGVVYYANYLTYFERARTEWFNERGLDLRELTQKGVLFVVSQASVDYKSPARYGEILKVSTKVKEASFVKLDFEHSVHEKQSGRLICTGTTRLVCVSPDMKPQRLPEDIYSVLAEKNS